MTSRSRSRTGGRILPHERDADDTVAILGSDLQVQDAHRAAVRATEQKDKELKTKRDMRNRIQHIYKFWETEYPDYYGIGTKGLTDAELSDPDQFHHRNKRDLQYTGMNVKMVKAFLGSKKFKDSGKMNGFSNIRKYHDAILHGAKCANVRLPREYYEEINKFLDAYKKETRQGRKEGKLDEREADPISKSLFRSILTWALDSKNIYVWVFSLLQWNCMARSINIGVLAFHNFRCGEDNIVCCYDKTKADQAGEKVHDKHMYANPYDPLVCCHLALGVWLSLNSAQFVETENFFNASTNEENAASQRYCSQLVELFRKHADALQAFIRANHANAHGIRKGSATSASSGTTCPPPVSSIAARGEWSLGKVLDLYWHFAEPGDHYLGRILAFLDETSEKFAVLPPHFSMVDPMADKRVKEAMVLMFGHILSTWANTEVHPTGILLRCLASVVWHIEYLQEYIRKVPGHPFGSISLLNDPELVAYLKTVVTLEPCGQVTAASGIPPHIKQAVKTNEILEACKKMLETMGDMTNVVQSSVSQAFEDKAIENGQLTADRVIGILDSFKEKIVKEVGEKIQAIDSVRTPTDRDNGPQTEGRSNQNRRAPPHREYIHSDGKTYSVPEKFDFPSNARLDSGWNLWLVGMPGHETTDDLGNSQSTPVRPFRLLEPVMLPAKLKTKYSLHWRPIFQLMEQAPGLILREPAEINAEYLQESFQAANNHLKTRVGYVFQNRKAKPATWVLSTWSKKVSHSEIVKHGTDEDRANLPSENRFNRPRQQKRRNRGLSSSNRVRRRARANAIGRSGAGGTAGGGRTSTSATIMAVSGEQPLPDPGPLTERQRAREREHDALNTADIRGDRFVIETANQARFRVGY